MEPGSDATSPSLIRRAQVSDKLAWEQLVDLYGPLVYRWTRQAGLNTEDSADVFQETFSTVARKLESFTPKKKTASFRSWLKTIVRTRTIDLVRKKKKHAEAAGGTIAQAQMAELADPVFDESNEASQSDDALVIRKAMDSIKDEFDPRNWRAFEQVIFENQSPADIARELGIDPQVIRQSNYRIRRRLKGMLEGLVDDVI